VPAGNSQARAVTEPNISRTQIRTRGRIRRHQDRRGTAASAAGWYGNHQVCSGGDAGKLALHRARGPGIRQLSTRARKESPQEAAEAGSQGSGPASRGRLPQLPDHALESHGPGGSRPEVIRDNMGHATIDVTQNVYGKSWWDSRVEAVSKAAAAIFGLSAGPSLGLRVNGSPMGAPNGGSGLVTH
jgi:hypothetical protein